jgi:hypothetical protein
MFMHEALYRAVREINPGYRNSGLTIELEREIFGN